MAVLANISEALVDETPLLTSNDDLVEGSVDYKGSPARRSKSGKWPSACFILVVEMAERSAYFGISSNLITFLTGPLGQTTATAAKNLNAWSGTSQLLPLLGGFVADSFLGRFRSIVIASLLYILGLGLLTFSAIIPSFKSDDASQLQIVMFFLSLYFVSIAQGLHKPCVQAFGADQFDELHPDECRAKSSFFNWWAFGISVAIIIALLVLTYIQEYLSWGLGFGIPCFLMVFALVFFLIGIRTYRFRTNVNQGEGFARICHVFVKAASNWKASPSSVSFTDEQSSQFKFLNKALVAADSSNEDEKVCSIKEVEEAKAFLRLFPIWLSCLVYGIVYSQPGTLFIKQGLTMNRSIGSRFEVPAASLSCIINGTLIVFIPVYDRILVPITRSITKRPSGLTVLQRIGIGVFFSVLSMSIAAVVEKKRLETAKAFGLVGKPDAIVPMSMAWLVPQYLLFGMSESFAFVGLQEFFYDQVPNDLKSTGVALYLSVMGVGGFLSSILISVIEKVTDSGGGKDENGWFCDNLNKAHLDYFYWLLIGLSAFSLAAFVCSAKSYVYSRKQLLKLPESSTTPSQI